MDHGATDQPEGRIGPSAEPSTGGPASTPHPPLGAELARALVRSTDERLGEIHWFRTDWQRGGAATGYAVFDDASGPADVVVKVPVPPRELLWLRRLQPGGHEADEVAPRLYAGGEQLNGYDLAWVVMERLPHGPLGPQWQGAEFDLLVDAAARFYAAAERHPVDKAPRVEDWPAICRKARQMIREHAVPEEQRWNKALKRLQKKLKKLLEAWEARDTNHWCHGDLHLANALTREPPPHGPALLIDPAEVHAGHWVEDAVYLEHLYWGRDDRLAGRDLVKAIARARKGYGLSVESEWPRLADLRRVLLAGGAPAYLASEGGRVHLHAALDVLEAALDRLHA